MEIKSTPSISPCEERKILGVSVRRSFDVGCGGSEGGSNGFPDLLAVSDEELTRGIGVFPFKPENRPK